MGVLWREAAMETAVVPGREKLPTSERSRERNSRPFAYSSQRVTPEGMNYAFLCLDRPRHRCTR